MAALLTLGCAAESGPTVSAPMIAKYATKSGDAQSGSSGQPLPSELRVLVTRDGTPAAGVMVTWSTGNGGSLTPSSDQTDDNGLSSSVWTLGPTVGQQAATAQVEGSGPGSRTTFTATATP